ncbi:hypothetical protein AQUCO_02200311v1 [Aquilegia coerulea]|uniref:Uncharacterized protein n=1 Tax=Aquilegia coerulea TaxID=218851 RepID=A0A2G5DE43_AQUCA|nr:hypothetical protein AQUCO_02200311v1 [Aquilegia coerulea]
MTLRGGTLTKAGIGAVFIEITMGTLSCFQEESWGSRQLFRKVYSAISQALKLDFSKAWLCIWWSQIQNLLLKLLEVKSCVGIQMITDWKGCKYHFKSS